MSDLTFAISGTAMSTIEGSEIYASPERYDGGSQSARDAYAALHSATSRRAGKGRSYQVSVTRQGAQALYEFCVDVGQSYLYGDPDARAEGRALLVVARRIEALLGTTTH